MTASVALLGLLTVMVVLAAPSDARQRPAEAPLQIPNPHYAPISESIVVDPPVPLLGGVYRASASWPRLRCHASRL